LNRAEVKCVYPEEGEASMTRLVVLLGLVCAAGTAHAQHHSGQLIGVSSGGCVAAAQGSGVQDCNASPRLTFAPAPSGPGRFSVRDDSRGVCLFSNRDGRFGWAPCASYDDQQWTFVTAGIAGEPAAAESANGQLLRSLNSGRCLFANRDGRFGVYNCNANFPDQFWRVAREGEPLPSPWRPGGRYVPPPPDPIRYPPPPRYPPPVAQRDCGTGADDAGCQESRDGYQAMDRDTWAGLYASAQATASDFSRRDLIVSATAASYLTAKQLIQLLDLFRSELLKLELVKAVVGHVIDPRRALAYGPQLRSSFNREQFVRLVSGTAPPPPPPQVRCPPRGPCGIACPPGTTYATDENGCQLCECRQIRFQ
jgi:hypothetical protein